MRLSTFLTIVLLCCLHTAPLCAQTALQDVPAGDGTGIKKYGTSFTLEMAMPVGSMTYGLLTKNKKLIKTGLEAVCTKMVTMVVTEGYKHLADRNKIGLNYADYTFHFPGYEANVAVRQTSMAFASATSLAMRSGKWYIILPAYAYAGSVAGSYICQGKQNALSAIGTAAVGATSGLVAHWITRKIFPCGKNCLRTF